MEYNSLIIMEKNSGILVKELGSLEVCEGCEYIEKLYVEENMLNIYITYSDEVDDLGFDIIYENFNLNILDDINSTISEISEVYSPTFKIVTPYLEDSIAMQEVFNDICTRVKDEFLRISNDFLQSER